MDGERKSIKIKEKYTDPEQENHIMGVRFTLSGGNGGGVHRGWDGNSLYHRLRARLRQGGQLRLVTYKPSAQLSFFYHWFNSGLHQGGQLR
jgi:hypothetical protein